MREERKEGREDGRKAQLVHAVCRNCNTRRGSSGNEETDEAIACFGDDDGVRSLARPPFAFVFT